VSRHFYQRGTTTRDQAYVLAACWCDMLFNLSRYRVVEAIDSPLGIRKVVVESLDREGACPS
jgi:hypothetical protein